MKKMVAFIKQEAMEKAREIKVKADEEFAIEKAKIVRQETSNLDAQYERQRRQAEIEKRISQSNQTNKARLQLLEAREEMLESVFDEARSKLSNISKDEGKYTSLLESLTLQAFFSMMESDVVVSGRKKDSSLLKTAIDNATATFKNESGLNLKASIKEDLSDELAGGVKVIGYGNRIVVNNTLDERLRLLEEQMLPEIRNKLYGANKNRKYTN